MMGEPLSHEITTQRAGRTVAPLRLASDWGIKMRPEEGYDQLVRFVSKHQSLASSSSS